MKILWAGKPNSLHFAKPYIDYGDYAWLESKDPQHIRQSASGFDVLILEWGNSFAGEVIKEPLPCKVIIRIHDHEIYTGEINFINYKHVDAIWFINRMAMEDFSRYIPKGNQSEIRNKFLLPNAVDPMLFSCGRRKRRKRIGALSLGYKPRKRYNRLLDMMEALKTMDDFSEWSLVIRADPAIYPQVHSMLECEAKARKIPIEFQHRNFNIKNINNKADVARFFNSCSVVVSPSDHEGFHYSIAEGMLCGCYPVVYNWDWGDPRQFWEPYVHDTVEDMAIAIHSHDPDPLEYRKYVIKNFSAQQLVPELESIISNL